MHRICLVILATVVLALPCAAAVYNIKVVTDASPDVSDMNSLIRSVTGHWQTPEEKLWAMFYWNHIARRQTSPMMLHGLACTDPIRQFNDYGYTMCSTVSGINCSIWDAMGLPVKYWDISNHTVPEVQYGGRWHMYDNSLSALYTLCDGKTIAGVEDIGKTQGCAASDGVAEPGHVAKYHCLTATGVKGFLTGSDTARSLDEEYRCFNPNGLKYRPYYFDWDRGHRYILNLRDTESYTRSYARGGDTPAQYVPNGGKDPDSRFALRGNGVRVFTPRLTAADLPKDTVGLTNARGSDAGVTPMQAGKAGEVVFKVEGANVISGLAIAGTVLRKSAADNVAIAISTTNGMDWTEVWQVDGTGETPVKLGLVEPVSGAYEVLVRVRLLGQAAAADAQLRNLRLTTTTMLNAKTQPQLLLGKNTVYVGAGEQLGSIVLWPDLQGNNWKPYAADSGNMVSELTHPGYMGVMHAEKPRQDAWVTFRMEAPGGLKHVHIGARMYNRAPGAHIDFLHSFDGGKTWTKSYSLTDTGMPWDVIWSTTVEAPANTRSVLVKYLLNASEAAPNACSLYSVRMEANYVPPDARPTPLAVTFKWAERQADYSLVERSHTQIADKLPTRYTINVGGVDHPVVKSLTVCPAGLTPDAKTGYSDGKDAGGEKFQWRWVTYGKNLALGKPYTVSVPSNDKWGAGDPEGKKLTDGIVGPEAAGGTGPSYALGWDIGQAPEVTVDLGQAQTCAAFRMQLAGGWPWWDALKGEIKDRAEMLTSLDGTQFASVGEFRFNLYRQDIPINHMLPDDETLTGHLYDLIPAKPVQARYVRFRITPQRSLCVSEVEVLDAIDSRPFDLHIALPDDPVQAGEAPKVLTAQGRPITTESAAANSARVLGGPVLEPSTLQSLGAYWIIGGDDNKNAVVTVHYREVGSKAWREGPPLFRVERGAHKNEQGQSKLNVPDDGWLFAGSVLLLRPDAAYELKLALSDPDGGTSERVLQARTRAEPVAPADMRTRYVVPGTGGGAGTKEDPFRGLAAADAAAAPGDLFLVQAGTYPGTFLVTHSGEPGKPIIWRGEGEAILDGQGPAEKRPARIISASEIHDVWYENLTLRNGDYGIVAHNGQRVVVRRCHISGVDYGLTCTNNSSDVVSGFLICDNLVEGPSTWPRTQGIENARGIQITGTGHDVCYNRIRGFADAIDTFGSVRCAAIDIHHNDISEMTDDGNEMDYSERNTRCFCNRYTNVFQGISVQPIFGGPVYIFRNVLYNVEAETFKMHNSPSGAMMIHNTSVKAGVPLVLSTNEKVRNCVYRNNLFVGTTGNYAYETTAPMAECDFDYDGFGGGPWAKFLKWNDVRYDTIDDVHKRAPVEQHCVLVDPLSAFASGVLPPADFKAQVQTPPDLRLKANSAAVDAGVVLPGFNDGFAGSAPDVGAYELGSEPPHYGPR